MNPRHRPRSCRRHRPATAQVYQLRRFNTLLWGGLALAAFALLASTSLGQQLLAGIGERLQLESPAPAHSSSKMERQHHHRFVVTLLA